VQPNLINLVLAVTSLKRGARNRIFMSVVVNEVSGPVFVKITDFRRDLTVTSI
jgi:hypothetical protein